MDPAIEGARRFLELHATRKGHGEAVGFIAKYHGREGLVRWLAQMFARDYANGEELVFLIDGTDNVYAADRCLTVLFEAGLIARGAHRPGFSTAAFIGLEGRRSFVQPYPREYDWHPIPVEP